MLIKYSGNVCLQILFALFFGYKIRPKSRAGMPFGAYGKSHKSKLDCCMF